MGMNQLIYGGINTADYGIGISGGGTYSAPQRDVKRYEVPGRNGDLIVDNGRYKNVTVTYPAFLAREFVNRIDDFRSALMAKTGYQRIEDTYHPDEYRMGMIAKNFDPETVGAYNNSGTFDLSFYCKPQRFLRSGDQPMQFMPPVFGGGEMRSSYISVYNRADARFVMHCPADESITAVIVIYDSAKTEISRSTFTLTDGMGTGQTFGANEAYFRVLLSGFNDADKIYMTISGVADFNGAPLRYNAIFARTWYITNPTGYPSKPLIEVYGSYLSNMTIDNGDNYYVFGVNDTGDDRFYMDCGMQYLYNDEKQNLTNYLFMTDAQSDVGESLVFPELGGGQIRLYMYYNTIPADLGLVNIYPRWWRL